MSEVYTIEQIEEQDSKLTASINLDVNHVVFDGHFPQQSVLPGVVQLEIIKAILSQHLNKTFRMINIKNAKYLAMILPKNDAQFIVELEYKTIEDQSIKVKSIIKNDKSIFLKFSGEFEVINE